MAAEERKRTGVDRGSLERQTGNGNRLNGVLELAQGPAYIMGVDPGYTRLCVNQRFHLWWSAEAAKPWGAML
ncbi:hypothetical protein AAFF_G00324820 [Aldrovandia affinis]|uniref:Uncharacterized protein n=1 Tax=Aldrovandia affinis TaxID=143900 RepID=A0AAD7T8Z3_9TELE|nr:hypothetical protein AAFF_G00324820 [Aldrovandia affinis]